MSINENQPKKRGRPAKNKTVTETAAEKPKIKKDKPVTEKTDAQVIQDTVQIQPKKPVEIKEQGDVVFSLDIGTRTIVGILGINVDDKLKVIDVAVVPHPKRAMIDGQIEDIKQVAKVANMVKTELEERNNIKLSRVAIAAAGRALRTQNVSLEFDVENKDVITDDMVKSMEIETIQKAQEILDEASEDKNQSFYCVGHTVVKYTLDGYNILRLEGHKGRRTSVELIAAFLPGIVVESLYAVMDICGLAVESLTLEPIAAMNVIIPPEIRLINIALVDIGAGTSDIAIAKDGSIVAYAMATIAGDEITEEIIRAYLVDFNTAERIKQDANNAEIHFKDILGLPHTIKKEDLFEKITPALKNLAETICKNIVEVNRQKPAAVFLIGGGSQVNGLTAEVAKYLELDESRVAVGGQEFLKNVDANGVSVVGPEYVTPIGIAVTSTLNQGYDFSTITLNGEKVRIFNTRNLSMLDFLTTAGYKPQQIIGKSGRGLTYTLNGKKQNIKGGNFRPAEIYINSKPATIHSVVNQGDNIKVIPAADGTNASQKISDIVNMTGIKKGNITFGGHPYSIGTAVFVNGEETNGDYEIKNFDEIVVDQIRTLGDLLMNLSINLPNAVFLVEGIKITEDYVLCDKDNITFTEAAKSAAQEPSYSYNYDDYDNDYTAVSSEVKSGLLPGEKSLAQKIAERSESSKEPEIVEDIGINLNGHNITLYAKADFSQHLFLDLFNYVEIDPQNPKGDIILLLNGRTAAFSEPLKQGDVVVIKWADEMK